jgi:hypothetical protein
MKLRSTGVAAILLGTSLVGGWTLSNAANSAGTHPLRAPFHATARCNDGTWTWNKDPAGPAACSAHGGVAAIVQG